MIVREINVKRDKLLWMAWRCFSAWLRGAESITVTWKPKAEWEA